MCYYLRQPSVSPLDKRAMLGKCPWPSLPIASKSSGASEEDMSAGPYIARSNAETVGSGKRNPCYRPSVPQKVVIIVGFDIGSEIRLPDVCDSPRSVLDPNACEKQAFTRSGLYSAKNSSQGVGLAIIAHIKAEEELRKKATVQASHPRESEPISIRSNNHQQGGKRASGHKNGEDLGICSHKELACSTNNVDDRNVDDHSLGDVDDEMHPWFGHVHSHLNWEDDEDEDVENDDDNPANHKCIFAVASVPSDCSFDFQSMVCFDTCVFCQCNLLPREDVFMYRGDQAFCSVECRSRKIELDEHLEK